MHEATWTHAEVKNEDTRYPTTIKHYEKAYHMWTERIKKYMRMGPLSAMIAWDIVSRCKAETNVTIGTPIQNYQDQVTPMVEKLLPPCLERTVVVHTALESLARMQRVADYGTESEFQYVLDHHGNVATDDQVLWHELYKKNLQQEQKATDDDDSVMTTFKSREINLTGHSIIGGYYWHN